MDCVVWRQYRLTLGAVSGDAVVEDELDDFIFMQNLVSRRVLDLLEHI